MATAKKATAAELFQLALGELDQSVHQPNILRYGEKDYPEQLRFHKSDKPGRFISGGNRGGKCILQGTLVQMADGSVKKIEDIRAGEYVIAPDGSSTEVLEVWDKGLQPVNHYRVGRYQDVEDVFVTENHKFWSAKESHGTLKSFERRPIKEIVHEKRGRHKIMRSQGTALGGISESRALVLGLMLGDGHFGPRWPSNLQFTCADPTLIADLPGVFVPRATPIQYGFLNARDWFDWFGELGLHDTRSDTKFIPDVVWSWDEESIGAVIAGLAVTDGSWWTSTRGEHHFTYSSISRQLAEDFRRYAGLRLGIWGSTIRADRRGNYVLTYSTREALEKLAQLPLLGVKKDRARACVPKRNSKSSYVSVKEYTEVGMRQCYDLSVAHETHCFMLANGIFTSNTDAEVVEAVWWATNSHPYLKRPERWGKGPLQLRFVVVDIAKGVEQIIVPKLKRWIPKSQLVQGSWDKSWDAQNLILTFANGSTIDFVTWGMDMMKLGGVPRHAIFFDEEPPQHIFNESMMRLIDYKGFWVIAATPTRGMGWTYDLLWEPAEAGLNDKIDTFTLSAEQNPYIQAESEDMDFYMAGMDKEEREIREKGSFVARSGLVFPSFSQNLDRHTIELGYFDIPRGWEVYASVDHGINNPTAWLWHAVSPNNDIITFAEHYQSDMIVGEHAEVVKTRERMWGKDPENVERMGDPAMKQRNGVTGTSIIQEYARNGIYINVEGIPHAVEVGIEKMQSYFRLRDDSFWGPNRPKWVVSTNCPNFIREMRKLRWATYSSDKTAYEMNKQEVVHKKDDHAFDSARYFATTRPDLSPVVSDQTKQKLKPPTTITYEEMMLRMREDPDIRFTDDIDTSWDETSMYGEYYSEDLAEEGMFLG